MNDLSLRDEGGAGKTFVGMTDKIKWRFWNPHLGKDGNGKYYLRIGHWSSIAVSYLKILIFLFAMWLIGMMVQ